MKERVEAIELFCEEARTLEYDTLNITRLHFLQMADIVKDLYAENQDLIHTRQVAIEMAIDKSYNLGLLEDEKIERNKAIQFQAEIVESLQKTIYEIREENQAKDKEIGRLKENIIEEICKLL